ncbi:hypothetical protein OJAV_G00115290 [Oryzias javanicus]|uniref:EF-hand domain-containing protein n=1 Tax=Oryzias javanicus TaxID=123683 RepID=A0A3S2P5M7_ORYJA|nr:hypothetical protein OJAV_G00115290 [Oryzias javanicus]
MGAGGGGAGFSADVCICEEDEARICRGGAGTAPHTCWSALCTGMEAAITTIVSQFQAYAGSEGCSSTLSKDEFQKLVAAQLPNFVKNASDPGVIDQLMSSIDENNDGELTFSEFWQLIGKLASRQGGFSQ